MTPSAPHSISMYRRIVTAFLLLTAVVVALVAYVVLARGTVVILSKQEPASADFIVDVAAQPSGSEVRGTVLQASDSLVETFPTSSVVKIDVPVQGSVRIISTLYRPQTLIATTRLLSASGVLFRLKEDVVVPANGFVTAEVFADQSGNSGLVGETTFSIPGLSPDSQRFFTVRTEGEFAGATRDQRMVTRADVEAAEAALDARLRASLAESLRAKAREAGMDAGAAEFFDYEIARRDTDAPIGEERPEFTLSYALKATAVFYDGAAFRSRIERQITDHLSYGRALREIDDSSITADVEKVDLVAGRANLRVTAKATTVLATDSPEIRKDKLLGVSADSAKKYLEKIDGVSSVSVSVRPFFLGRLPNVPEHITIEVR